MIIAIDFDGTCVTHEFPNVGKDIGAIPVLKELIEKGHSLILFTMRSNRTTAGIVLPPEIKDVFGTFLDDAVNWFRENNIPLYGVNINPNQISWTTSPKAYAELYIDDAGLGIPLKVDYSLSKRPFVDWIKVKVLLEDLKIL